MTPRSIGLILCTLLGLLDVAGVAGIGLPGAPIALVLLGALLGAITLVGAVLAWRERRGGLAAVIVTRVLSALLGIPVFFVDDAPGWARVVVLVALVLTVVALWLIRPAARPALRG